MSYRRSDRREGSRRPSRFDRGSRQSGGRSSYGGGSRSFGGRSSYGGGRGSNSFPVGGGRKTNIGNGQPGSQLRPVDWSRMQLETFPKTFMQGIQNLPPDQIQSWRQQNNITVEGSSCPAPLRSFAECPFPQSFMEQFQRMGFQGPTPCQAQGWSMALTGKDVVCIAETGSGKTIGFILPALIHIRHQKPLQQGDGPIALVVAPTRELACQIEKEARAFGGDLGVRMTCVYGGAPKRNQEYALRRGCELVICTPGRMLDFIERRLWRDLSRTTYVVFDEADRMLDMGFEPQIRALLGQIRPDRQMQMWSATWPKEVRRLASDFLPNDKIVMKIGSDDGKACERVTQETIICSSYDKMNHLQTALVKYVNTKVLVFTATKRMADDLAYKLRGCCALRGDSW